MSRTDAVLAAIDAALDDPTVSADAMRSAPDDPTIRHDDTPSLTAAIDRSSAYIRFTTPSTPVTFTRCRFGERGSRGHLDGAGYVVLDEIHLWTRANPTLRPFTGTIT